MGIGSNSKFILTCRKDRQSKSEKSIEKFASKPRLALATDFKIIGEWENIL
jgi:hypothetical protein